MYKPLIAGNWKLNGTIAQAEILIKNIAKTTNDAAECLICPPATLLHKISEWTEDTEIKLGGQDCSAQESGAFTGEISAAMLKDVGAEYVILGHSERRMFYGETDENVCKKAEIALKNGLNPIICIGESLAQQEAGHTLEVIRKQIATNIPNSLTKNLIIAYEPVWAIGSGKIPSLNDIEMVHSTILATLSGERNIDYTNVRVLYGGSVKANNAADILAVPAVGGLLVGGASLVAEEFCAILAAANQL